METEKKLRVDTNAYQVQNKWNSFSFPIPFKILYILTYETKKTKNNYQ